MSQPGYDPTQYQPPVQPYPGYPQQFYPPAYLEGQKFKETSLIFGIIGLFVLGFVFGPLAIIHAGKAEERGHPATAGKVLGWIATIMSIGSVLFVIGLYVFAGIMTASGMT